LPFSKWPPQYRTNSTLFDFNVLNWFPTLTSSECQSSHANPFFSFRGGAQGAPPPGSAPAYR
jgi:hypothetical protein